MKSSINSGRDTERGFTLIELLAVIAIVGLLAAMIFPVLGNARAKGQATYCVNNLRQLGIAVTAYASDFDQRLPLAEPTPSMPVDVDNPLPRIRDLLEKYVGGSAGVFQCPSDHDNFTAWGNAYTKRFDAFGSSYEWVAPSSSTPPSIGVGGLRLDNLYWLIGLPPGVKLNITASQAVIMFDYQNFHQNQSGGTRNVLYADGHVETP